MAAENDSLAASWLSAASDERIAARLEAVYLMLSEQIEARGPACWASGRCCNFDKTGHRLYVTGLEAAYTVSRIASPERAVNDRPVFAPLPTLDAAVRAAETRGDCPFLDLNLCGVHRIKPLGCRVYFCDRSAETWQEELSERGLRMIRSIHDEFGLSYRYGEWRAMLRLFASAPH